MKRLKYGEKEKYAYLFLEMLNGLNTRDAEEVLEAAKNKLQYNAVVAVGEDIKQKKFDEFVAKLQALMAHSIEDKDDVKKDVSDLKDLYDRCKPLVEYMRDNFTPNDSLVITDKQAKIFKGDKSVPVPFQWE